jgi:antitoxin PrlF
MALQSKLTAQGQTSVPAEIRRKLGLAPGSVLQWEEEGDRFFIRRAARYSWDDIHRALFAGRPKPKHHTIEEMDEGILEYMRKKHARR